MRKNLTEREEIGKKLSKTIVCPRCGKFATTIGRTKEFYYIVECRNCGKFKINGLEQRESRRRYTMKLKAIAKNISTDSLY
jgi:uncharacterized Zn finger protein